MNRPGHCTDNAEVESFFHTLKGDIIRKNSFKSEKQLRDKLVGYIQHFYNRYRLHSSLGYRSPHEYEVMTGLKKIGCPFYRVKIIHNAWQFWFDSA